MRFLGKLIIGLVLVIGALAAGAFALPREVTVARTVTINAPAEKIFPYMNDLRKFNEWSPWARIDADTAFTFSGPDSGTGQKMAWTSDHDGVGTGSSQITESVPPRRVTTALDLGDHGTADATFTLEPAGAGTKVTWGFRTDTGNNPMMRWMGLMFDRWVGADYEKGLDNLKTMVEGA